MNSVEDDDGSGRTPPPCFCLPSPATIKESMFGISSNNNMDESKTESDNNDLESKTSSLPNTWGSSSTTKVSDYAIARSRIAVEAAMEARRRYAMKDPNNVSTMNSMQRSSMVVTSIGRGSCAADAIHQRDQRPLWKQGFDDDNGGDDDAHNPSIYGLRLSTASIAEHAAAVGRSKQKQWDHKEQELLLDKMNYLDPSGEPQTDTLDHANDGTPICKIEDSCNANPRDTMQL